MDDVRSRVEKVAESLGRSSWAEGETWGIRSRLEEMEGDIGSLEAALESIRREAGSMMDAEFDELVSVLDRRVREVEDYIEAGKVNLPEIHTTGFIRWEQIDSLESFCREMPVYWIPTKEDVGRILAVAKTMHEQTVARGESPAGGAMRVLDIGGASGALGKLVVDLARENGLDITYEVADPLEDVVRAARRAYAGVPEMRLSKAWSHEFVREQHRKDAEVSPLLAERARLTDEGNRHIADLETFQQIFAKRQEAGALDTAELARLYDIVANELGVRLSPEARTDVERFKLELYGGWCDQIEERWPPANEFVRQEYDAKVKAITEQVERLLGERPPEWDLVINSWMSPFVDFTRDIRLTGGAALMYMVQNYGATGTQPEICGGEPRLVGEGASYETGRNYRLTAVWAGRSVPELAHRDSDEYCNGVLLQLRRDRKDFDVSPEANGIKLGEAYAWEEELLTNGAPTAVEKPEVGDESYHDTVQRAIWKAGHGWRR